MGIMLRIDIDGSKLEKQILQALIKKNMQFMKKNLPAVEKSVKDFLHSAIESTDVWQSLKTQGRGELKTELGLISETPINQVLDKWIDGVIVKISKQRDEVYYRITAIKSDYADVLSLPLASYNSTGNTVSWLRWLLLENDEVLVADFDILYGPNLGRAGAIMTPGPNYKLPERFRTGRSFIEIMTENPGFESGLIEAILKALKR